MDSEASPKTRRSSSRPTPNGYHANGSFNGPTVLATTSRSRAAPRTAWELADLIRPLPQRQRSVVKRPRVLPHYAALVKFLLDNRFATLSQIQRRFAEFMPADRTSRYQLASLVSLGHLATAPVRSTSPNFPYVYYATPQGLRFVRESFAELRQDHHPRRPERIRPRGVTVSSILHELLVTEFDLTVWQTVERSSNLAWVGTGETDSFLRDQQLVYDHAGRTGRLSPDSGFLVQTTPEPPSPTGRLLLHLTEIDNGTESPRRILAKYRGYQHWYGSEQGRDFLATRCGTNATRAGFRLLVVAHAYSPTDRAARRLLDLFAQALELPRQMRERIWLTTVESLRQHQDDPLPLAAPIWWRARDARSWLGAYRQQVARSPRRGPQQYERQRRFLAARMPNLARWPLFQRLLKGA